MKNPHRLNKYHKIVIAIYLLLTPLFFALRPAQLNYSLFSSNPTLALFLATLTILVFHLFLRPKMLKRPDLRFHHVLVSVIYAFMFALPEEILFRGIIQKLALSYYDHFVVAIIVSAFIYGIAHLLNGAKGFAPPGWNWGLAGLTFAVGIPLGLIFSLTDSLLIPTLLHAYFIVCLNLFARARA